MTPFRAAFAALPEAASLAAANKRITNILKKNEEAMPKDAAVDPALLQDQAEQDGGDEALGQLDASFTLMMLTFGEFLPALIEALGGEETPQGI